MIARFRSALGWSLALLCVAGCAGCTGPLDADQLTLPGEFGSNAKAGKDSPDAKTLLAELANGRNLERAGNVVAARDVYQRLVANYPDRYQPYHRLALVADRQRRHREAESLYAQAIRLRGRDPQLFNDLGYCLHLQGKLNKAESAMRKAVAMAPAEPRFRNNLGLVLAYLGRHGEALEQFKRAGSKADAFYNLAFVHASQDRTEQAKECFRLALAADPTHERSRLALISFAEYEKDPDAAADFAIDTRGGRWIPYVEGADADVAGAPEPAKPTVTTTPRPVARGPVERPNTQALLHRARAMMSRRTAGERWNAE